MIEPKRCTAYEVMEGIKEQSYCFVLYSLLIIIWLHYTVSDLFLCVGTEGSAKGICIFPPGCYNFKLCAWNKNSKS